MATTATNKQPLLVDRVLHSVINLDNAITSTLDIVGTNTAEVLINGSSSDGAIVEYIYGIGRGGGAGEKINLYMSSAVDYLRQTEAMFIGSFSPSETEGTITEWDNMPKILAPMPHTGDEGQFRALYLPKGKSLWAARQSDVTLVNGPLIGAQGGWF